MANATTNDNIDQTTVQIIISEHFNLKQDEVKETSEPDEWSLLNGVIEAVSMKQAFQNERDLDNEVSGDIVDYIHEYRIGMYKRLGESNFYFRWL
ncbi:hypothetical protein [Halobacteriovorax sp. CON-3]|uniref:hypothetical protein n=1 Tax=Halobacteriovorax sp. CON-3 TaxID=3157710 RepID=UPI00370FD6B3